MAQPGMRLAAASSPQAAYEMLRAAIRNGDPVLFFEHKALYPRKGQVRRGVISDIGTARVLREGSDVTVVTWGSTVYLALDAARRAEKRGLSIEVLDLRSIVPLDEEILMRSIRKTSRVVVLTEEQTTGSVAGEVAARIAQHAFDWLDGPVHRLCCPDTPVPYSPTLEEAYLPNVEKLVARVRELAGY